MKHGRRWCYVGPLEAVDLSGVIIDLSDYHYFTTKIKESMSIIRVRDVKVSTLVFTSLLLVLVAYSLSIASYNAIWYTRFYMETASQVLVTIAVFTALIATALYELKYKRRIELRTPGGMLGHVLSILIASAALFVSLIAFTPLSSTLTMWSSIIVQDARKVVHYVEYGITLSCLMLVSLVSLLVVRSVSRGIREFVIKLLVSSILASNALYASATLYEVLFNNRGWRLYVDTYLDVLGHSLVLGFIITLITAVYLAGISVFKRLISMELA